MVAVHNVLYEKNIKRNFKKLTMGPNDTTHVVWAIIKYRVVGGGTMVAGCGCGGCGCGAVAAILHWKDDYWNIVDNHRNQIKTTHTQKSIKRVSCYRTSKSRVGIWYIDIYV